MYITAKLVGNYCIYIAYIVGGLNTRVCLNRPWYGCCGGAVGVGLWEFLIDSWSLVGDLTDQSGSFCYPMGLLQFRRQVYGDNKVC